jgi:CheY-like chemotaxis protein
VDDEESVANMLGAVLRHVGFEVEIHNDSLEAKRRFEEQPDGFDLLLTDQTMPKMTGAELAKFVLSVRPDLPVVLCTGYSAEVDEVSALALGVRAYLPKPLITAQLIQTLNELLADPNPG